VIKVNIRNKFKIGHRKLLIANKYHTHYAKGGGMSTKVLSCLFCISFVYAVDAVISVSLPENDVVVTVVNDYAKFHNNVVYGEPGCPALPSKCYTFLVPPDADLSSVSFEIQGLTEKRLDGKFTVQPARPPMSVNGPVWPEKRNIVNGRDMDIYGGSGYYPDSYIQDITVSQMRCYKIVRVRVYFSKYNPGTGTLKCLTGGKLALKFAAKPGTVRTGCKIPKKYRKLAEKMVINYSDMAPLYNTAFTFTDTTTYIIMTESSIESGSQKLEELKQSKTDHGFNTEIITEDTWGGGAGNTAAGNMRKWLQDNYEEMAIEYVLLIGNPSTSSSKVPMYNSETRSRATDFYYSELTGPWKDDLIAEVDASRIPVYNDDMNTLDDILQKVIDYENAPADEIDWRKFCFIAEKPYDSQTPGYPLFEEIKTKFLDPNGWDNYRIYDVSNGDPDESDCNETAVKNAWEKLDHGLMLWMTHGSATGASSIMKSTTMATFDDEHPTIVMMGSCSNASPSKSDNLTYTALKHAAIGAIGGSGITWYGDAQVDNFDGTSTTQGLLYHFAQGITDSLGAGEALNFAIGQCTSKKWWINLYGYVLYGCPDVGVFSCKNETPVKNSVPDQKGTENSLSVITPNNGSDIIQIRYSVAYRGPVNLSIYTVQGKLIQTLVNTVQPANACSVQFSAEDLVDGIYFCSLKMGTKSVLTEKLMIVQ